MSEAADRKSERDEFRELIPVSHETIQKLDRYAELLLEWNQKFNLIAPSTEAHIWRRHFLDSAQLRRFIPEDAKSIADIGAGAGFPGLVLAILGAPKIYLIESVTKKANFLREVIADLKLDAEVRNERAENIKDLKADVIMARACAPLSDLFKYAKSLAHKDSLYIFPKGQNADAELTDSLKYWTFAQQKVPSLSGNLGDNSGSVLIIRDVQAKNFAPKKRRR